VTGAAAPGRRFQGAATLNKMNTSYGNIPFFFALTNFLNYWDKQQTSQNLITAFF
jgi:hypothetical protein